MSKRLPEVGGVFLQAENEVSAINMVYGAAGAGARVMTSSSSPGMSLKQEGISYIAAAELPCVLVNIVRGGPGLGGIQPAQSDYFQATKGGGHGDYRLIVLAPATLQETVDFVRDAFDLADLYRTPVMILGDGLLGQMMEPVEFKERPPKELPVKDWALTGARGREKNIINTLYLQPEKLEEQNIKLQKKYQKITENEVRYELYNCEEADLVVVAYGTVARIAKTAIEELKKEGLKVGMIRPITLWPFPVEAFEKTISTAKSYLAIEMSTGQMVEDVRLAVNGRKQVDFYGRSGGVVPTPAEISEKIKEIVSRWI